MPKLVNADRLLLDVKTGWWPQDLNSTLMASCLERLLEQAPESVTRCEHCLFRDTEHPDWCHAHMSKIQLDGFCNYGRPRNARQ